MNHVTNLVQPIKDHLKPKSTNQKLYEPRYKSSTSIKDHLKPKSTNQKLYDKGDSTYQCVWK